MPITCYTYEEPQMASLSVRLPLWRGRTVLLHFLWRTIFGRRASLDAARVGPLSARTSNAESRFRMGKRKGRTQVVCLVRHLLNQEGKQKIDCIKGGPATN